MVLTIKMVYGAMNWVEGGDVSSVGQTDMIFISVQNREARKWHEDHMPPF